MKKLILLYLFYNVLLNPLVYAAPPYLERFKQFMYYKQHLPPDAQDATFIRFISKDAPLSNRLRNKWLYELAKNKNWTTYATFYQNTSDLNLQCYHHIASYYQDSYQKSFDASYLIWQEGTDKPPSCNALFNLLKNDPLFNEHLISERIRAALESNNTQQALLLMKHYHVIPRGLIKTILNVYQNPSQIRLIPTSDLQGSIYLFGIKRLAMQHLDKALSIWNADQHKHILDGKQLQALYVFIALQKAIKGHDDAVRWFAKIKPEYYTDLLLEWQIRYALKANNWSRVSKVIDSIQSHDAPIWSYWLARSLKANPLLPNTTGEEHYHKIAPSRNYYGFLASYQIRKKNSFNSESTPKQMHLLKPYKSILQQVKALYLAKQQTQASQLLNDFILELPKNELSVLVYWLATDLQWYAKSVALADSDLLNDQLSLRFPLAYQKIIEHRARQYSVAPELIYAIIRQESKFRTDAGSVVGARGLMQLMPSTAKSICSQEHIHYKNPNDLYNPEKNIHIGTAYLKQLAKRFDNHPILIAAAYNAGPKQVLNWLRTHPPTDVDVWIETLPWQETRNYLKNVLAYYLVYQHRLYKRSDISPFMKPLVHL